MSERDRHPPPPPLLSTIAGRQQAISSLFFFSPSCCSSARKRTQVVKELNLWQNILKLLFYKVFIATQEWSLCKQTPQHNGYFKVIIMTYLCNLCFGDWQPLFFPSPPKHDNCCSAFLTHRPTHALNCKVVQKLSGHLTRTTSQRTFKRLLYKEPKSTRGVLLSWLHHLLL